MHIFRNKLGFWPLSLDFQQNCFIYFFHGFGVCNGCREIRSILFDLCRVFATLRQYRNLQVYWFVALNTVLTQFSSLWLHIDFSLGYSGTHTKNYTKYMCFIHLKGFTDSNVPCQLLFISLSLSFSFSPSSPMTNNYAWVGHKPKLHY